MIPESPLCRLTFRDGDPEQGVARCLDCGVRYWTAPAWLARPCPGRKAAA